MRLRDTVDGAVLVSAIDVYHQVEAETAHGLPDYVKTEFNAFLDDCRLPRDDQQPRMASKTKTAVSGRIKTSPRAPALPNEPQKHVEQPPWPTLLGVFWR